MPLGRNLRRSGQREQHSARSRGGGGDALHVVLVQDLRLQALALLLRQPEGIRRLLVARGRLGHVGEAVSPLGTLELEIPLQRSMALVEPSGGLWVWWGQP